MKAGPIETVSGKGQTVQIYKSQVVTKGQTYDSFRLIYYRGGRKRERAKSLSAAKERAKILIEEMAGNADQNPFTPDERRVVDTALDVLAPLDIPLSEAARRLAEAERILAGRGTVEEAARLLVQQQEKKQLPPITFGELYAKFMATLMTEEIPGKIESRVYHKSFRYWQDSSQRLGAAAEIFNSRQIAEITTNDLEAFLDAVPLRSILTKEEMAKRKTQEKIGFNGKYSKTTGRTRDNYRGALCTLFSFARRKHYLARGVTTEAEHIVKNNDKGSSEIGIYTIEEIQKILADVDARWVPFVAIGAFAGARAAEIHRLNWEDFNFEEGHIEMAKAKTKTATRRVVPILPNLAAWLKPHSQKIGPVCPRYSHDSTLLMEFSKSFKKCGVTAQHNGFRHSFASYRLAQIQNSAQTALEMGTSERKLTENYKELVSAKKGQLWFEIFPKKQSKKAIAKSASSSRQ